MPQYTYCLGCGFEDFHDTHEDCPHCGFTMRTLADEPRAIDCTEDA